MRRAVVLALVSLAVVLASAATWVAAVDVDLPEPSGPHAVGRMQGEFARGSDAGERRVAYTAYYPAQEGTGEVGPYMPPAIAGAVAERDLGAFRHLPGAWSRIHHHDRDGAAWSPGAFPLVVFAPGADVQPQYYASMLAELASHGYVVAALSHPGLTPSIAYADGSVLHSADPPRPGSEAEAFRQHEERIAAVSGDVQAALGHLLSEPRLRAHLDGRAAAFGHSLGGAGAVAAAVADPRLLAVGDMDGSLGPSARGVALGRPVFFMQDDGPVMPQDRQARADFVRGGAPGLKVTLHGGSHMAFATDTGFFEEARPFGGLGGLGAQEAFRDITRPLLEFFADSLPSA